MPTHRERRVEQSLRRDTDGTFDAQQDVRNWMKRLETEGMLNGSAVEGGWEHIRTVDENYRAGALATSHEFDVGARHNGLTLDPAFAERKRAYVGLERGDEEWQATSDAITVDRATPSADGGAPDD